MVSTSADRSSRSFRFSKWARIVLCVLNVSSAALPAQDPDHATERGVFTAVVKAVVAETPGTPVLVDPRPIQATPERLVVTDASVVMAPLSLIEARRAAMRALGIDSVDAVAVGLNARCPTLFSTLQSPDSAKTSDPFRGCPRTRSVVIAVGLARKGYGTSNGSYDSASQHATEGYWAVRVARTDIGPGGSELRVSDYVLKCASGAWHLVMQAPLFRVE